jgi:hypothetical protein
MCDVCRRIPVATHQLMEEFKMATDVAIEIHAHETRKLDESRINVPHKAPVHKRHLGNDILAEPFRALLLSSIGPPAK